MKGREKVSSSRKKSGALKRRQKVDSNSLSVPGNDATDAKWLDDILKMSEEAQKALDYAAAHTPCLSVPDAKTEKEFLYTFVLKKFQVSMSHMRVIFEPLKVADFWRETRSGDVPWIFVECPGGSYSPDTAIGAMQKILQEKIAAYARSHGSVCLLVYYAAAVAHNTPWYGINTRKFSDVAKEAAG